MAGLTGAVLAGGHSRRFGSNKALFIPSPDTELGQLLDGQSFLERALDVIRPVCDEVIISASKANANEYSQYGAAVVIDEFCDCGPLGGIASVLSHSANDWTIFLTCDMPFVTTDTLIRMSDECRDDVDAVMCSQFPLMVNKRVLPVLKDEIDKGNLRVRRFFEKIRTRRFTLNDRESTNINNLESK